MPELAPADLPAALLARFEDNAAAQAAIDTALVAARRYCGWHVSPVKTETVVVDGRGGRVLSLPTLKLVDLISVTERGVELDVSSLQWSRRGMVRNGTFGLWTSHYGGIEAEMQHGFTEAEAADWRAAVVSLVLMFADTSGSDRDDPSLKRKRVDDVELEWFEARITSDDRLTPLFSQFRILPE